METTDRDIKEIVAQSSYERKRKREFPGPTGGSDPEWVKQSSSYIKLE